MVLEGVLRLLASQLSISIHTVVWQLSMSNIEPERNNRKECTDLIEQAQR